MPTRGTKPPLVYIYLDAEGIESLYAQTVDRLEVELVHGRSKEGRAGVGLRVGFGNLLTNILGLKDASAETKLETVREHIEEAKTRLTTEHKLSLLLKHLASLKGSEYFESLQDGATHVSETGRVVFVHIYREFDVPSFYPGRGGAAEANASKAVMFTIEPRYDHSDQYFKTDPFRFVMSAGLEKFTRLHGSMGQTSHDAITFRGFSGKDIRLGVFGHLIHLSGLNYQIKPYAIWLKNAL